MAISVAERIPSAPSAAMYAQLIGRMLALPYGADETRPSSPSATTWKERREMLHHADRPHPWSAAAVGNCERLVQVEVTDIGAECAWLREADLRIHVCAVHIDLAAGRVHRVADLANRLFKDAVCARVGHHQRAE